MDKIIEENNFNHGITISERKSIIVSGVKKIESFDNEEFLMETNMGFIVLKGEELEIIKLSIFFTPVITIFFLSLKVTTCPNVLKFSTLSI